MSWTETEQKRREREPRYWHKKSSGLKAAAGALHFCINFKGEKSVAQSLGLDERFDMNDATWPVYLMLCGLSLETIYKGAIIAKHGKLTPNHKLVELSKAADVHMYTEDEGLIEILADAVYWYGKYPAPLAKFHEKMESLSRLATQHLTERVPELSIALRRSKSPHPLEWEGFCRLWAQGNEAFQMHISNNPF